MRALHFLLSNAVIKYGAAIKETAALLDELISLVKAIDPVLKRAAWPRPLLLYLAERQDGICPECKKALFGIDDSSLHVDHVVPWVQGGDNGLSNLCLLHARCNLHKGDGCNPDDVIQYLQSRLLNMRTHGTAKCQ